MWLLNICLILAVGAQILYAQSVALFGEGGAHPQVIIPLDTIKEEKPSLTSSIEYPSPPPPPSHLRMHQRKVKRLILIYHPYTREGYTFWIPVPVPIYEEQALKLRLKVGSGTLESIRRSHH